MTNQLIGRGRRVTTLVVALAIGGALAAACVPTKPPPGPQGTITGTLTNGTHPLSNFGLGVINSAGTQEAGANTNAAGQYSVQVPPGSYRINYPAGGPCKGEWFDNKPDAATADVIDVADGAIVPANAVLDCPTIRGRITDASGAPLSSVKVLPVAQPGTPIFILPAFTDSNGNYTAFVAAGTHILHLDRGDECVEFYDNKLGPSTADVVTVPPGGSVTVNAVLDCGTISGTVTDGSVPIPDVGIHVYDGAGNLVHTNLTDANGNYSSVIAAGVYSVKFVQDDFVEEWWNDKANLATADDVMVTDHNATTADAILLHT